MTSVQCLRDSEGFWCAAPGTSQTVCLDFIFDLTLKENEHKHKNPSKMALCSFLEEIKDQNFHFYNFYSINKVEIQTQNTYLSISDQTRCSQSEMSWEGGRVRHI